MGRRLLCIFFAVMLMLFIVPAFADTPKVKLGDEQLFSDYHNLISGKKIGLITNQTGINSKGESIVDHLANDKSTQLVALYSPEHGLDGQAKAGAYVESYVHPKYGIPVYSLYGDTRMPTEEMLKDVDALVFDIQDIGARTYTYISTLNYCMLAAQKYNKQIIVLDRPNPLGGELVEGPVLEDRFQSFVGVDNLPMAHGMTVGEIAQFFNRKIGADLKVVPMAGYTRKMIFQDTGLPWEMTSPNIADLTSAFGYMATGLGEGTGIYQADKFTWIGGKGIDAHKYAELLNNAGLVGIRFIPEAQGTAGGVRLQITDYHTFNPAKTGFYALAYAEWLNHFKVPKSDRTIIMFDKIMGTDKIGQYLEQGLSPQQIEAKYAPALKEFQKEREKYLIYKEVSNPKADGKIHIMVNDSEIPFDAAPFIDKNNRIMVPLRAICEALGATVSWNEAAQEINIFKNENNVKFKINQRTVLVNQINKQMDTTPIIRNNRTMIPLRYVSEFLGSTVSWDAVDLFVNIY